MYTKQIINEFKDPKNRGVIKNPDGVGEIGNPTCGDMMTLYIKVDSKKKLSDVKFQTYGCGAAIATSSMLTKMAKGKTISTASKITKDDILKKLGGKDKIPLQKFHCSVLAVDALKEAIKDYEKKTKTK